MIEDVVGTYELSSCYNVTIDCKAAEMIAVYDTLSDYLIKPERPQYIPPVAYTKVNYRENIIYNFLHIYCTTSGCGCLVRAVCDICLQCTPGICSG